MQYIPLWRYMQFGFDFRMSRCWFKERDVSGEDIVSIDCETIGSGNAQVYSLSRKDSERSDAVWSSGGEVPNAIPYMGEENRSWNTIAVIILFILCRMSGLRFFNFLDRKKGCAVDVPPTSVQVNTRPKHHDELPQSSPQSNRSPHTLQQCPHPTPQSTLLHKSKQHHQSDQCVPSSAPH